MQPIPDLDLRVYGVLDPARCGGRPPDELAAAAARGGATLIQLRAKDAAFEDLVETATAVKAALARYGVPLLINDRVDVAKAAGADGAHVGAEDVDPLSARHALGPSALLGVTVHRGHEADAVDAAVVDYASMGPVFATGSKDQADPPIGPDGAGLLIARLRRRLPRFPCCAIAGITHENAASVIAAGADGVAAIAELFRADDVEAAARRLRETVDRALVDAGTQRMPS
jgi:thiamine-phosphate pyrophosphorylase